MRAAFLCSFAALALAACATAQLPPDRLASSEAAIKSADAVGAAKYPQAALYMHLAQEEMATAQQLAKEGNTDRAFLFLDRSQADAELALALTREADAKKDADTAHSAVAAIEGKLP